MQFLQPRCRCSTVHFLLTSGEVLSAVPQSLLQQRVVLLHHGNSFPKLKSPKCRNYSTYFSKCHHFFLLSVLQTTSLQWYLRNDQGCMHIQGVEHLLQNWSSKSTNTNGTRFNDSTLALRNSSSIQNYTQDCITLVKSPWMWRSSSSMSGNVLSLNFLGVIFSFFQFGEKVLCARCKVISNFLQTKIRTKAKHVR